MRTLLWLLAVVVLVSILYATTDRLTLKSAQPFNPYLWTAMLGSAAAAVLGAIAAFELSRTGSSAWWMALPAPGVAIWFAATGFGCVGTLFAPTSWGHVPGEALECLLFITGTSLPLSAALLGLLRWSAPARPGLVGACGGLAIAASAATLLSLVHPHDLAQLDVMAHFVAIAAVVAANVAAARRIALRPAGGKTARAAGRIL